MCVGIDHCTKKNCLEQEKCLFPQEKTDKKLKINQCKIHKKFCSNTRVCKILGQCMLDHASVKGKKQVSKELRTAKGVNDTLKIFERLIPWKKFKQPKRKSSKVWK